jgi:hypothetical protein
MVLVMLREAPDDTTIPPWELSSTILDTSWTVPARI